MLSAGSTSANPVEITIPDADVDSTPPWGEGPVCLTGIALTGSQKQWLCRQVLSGKSTAAKLAKLYGIDRKLLNKWVEKMRKGVVIRGKAGHPPLIDEDVLYEAHQRMISEDVQRFSDQNQIIKEALQKTVVKHQSVFTSDLLKAEAAEEGDGEINESDEDENGDEIKAKKQKAGEEQEGVENSVTTGQPKKSRQVKPISVDAIALIAAKAGHSFSKRTLFRYRARILSGAIPAIAPPHSPFPLTLPGAVGNNAASLSLETVNPPKRGRKPKRKANSEAETQAAVEGNEATSATPSISIPVTISTDSTSNPSKVRKSKATKNGTVENSAGSTSSSSPAAIAETNPQEKSKKRKRNTPSGEDVAGPTSSHVPQLSSEVSANSDSADTEKKSKKAKTKASNVESVSAPSAAAVASDDAAVPASEKKKRKTKNLTPVEEIASSVAAPQNEASSTAVPVAESNKKAKTSRKTAATSAVVAETPSVGAVAAASVPVEVEETSTKTAKKKRTPKAATTGKSSSVTASAAAVPAPAPVPPPPAPAPAPTTSTTSSSNGRSGRELGESERSFLEMLPFLRNFLPRSSTSK